MRTAGTTYRKPQSGRPWRITEHHRVHKQQARPPDFVHCVSLSISGVGGNGRGSRRVKVGSAEGEAYLIR